MVEVILLWEALADPQADYRVFVQVRGADGTIVATQRGEPYGGAYPTSIWAAGEQIPDTYTVDIADLLPGDYEVYAGLLDPDGNRVITLAGQDAVLVGRVTVRE